MEGLTDKRRVSWGVGRDGHKFLFRCCGHLWRWTTLQSHSPTVTACCCRTVWSSVHRRRRPRWLSRTQVTKQFN